MDAALRCVPEWAVSCLKRCSIYKSLCAYELCREQVTSTVRVVLILRHLAFPPGSYLGALRCMTLPRPSGRLGACERRQSFMRLNHAACTGGFTVLLGFLILHCTKNVARQYGFDDRNGQNGGQTRGHVQLTHRCLWGCLGGSFRVVRRRCPRSL